MLTHPFAPVYDENSEILILGTFPSVKSRENEFYYGHPQNRFWKVLAAVFANTAGGSANTAGGSANTAGGSANKTADYVNTPDDFTNTSAVCANTPDCLKLHTATIEEKIQFLHEHHIALWDVIASCEITGSADASITNATPNDIANLVTKAPIRKICCNGTKAWELFQKYINLKKDTLLETKADFKLTAADNSQIEIVKLPSTSPANAAWTLEKLISAWKKELFTGDNK